MENISRYNSKVDEIRNEYLTVKELALALKLNQGTIRNRMQSGMYQLNVHYVKDGRNVRFLWQAIQRKLHSNETQEEVPRQKTNVKGCRINI